MVLSRFLPACLIAAALTAAISLSAAPADAAAAPHHATHPAHSTVRTVQYTTLRGFGSGGHVPAKVAGWCLITTRHRVMTDHGRTLHLRAVTYLPNEQTCLHHRQHTVRPTPAADSGPTITTMTKPDGTVVVTVVEPSTAPTATSSVSPTGWTGLGDPPPPGEDAEYWGPGSASWQYRIDLA